jgi:uncharacterized membrane protein
MYKIIGADQKEYGPISADQIRQWISEGRVNGQTQVCAEGSADWKPLEMFPEFGLAAGPSTAGIASPGVPAPASPEEILARDYTLDIVSCISRGWALFKDNFLTLFLTFLLFLVLSIGALVVIVLIAISIGANKLPYATTPYLNFIYSIFVALVMGPAAGGLYQVYLSVLRGQPATAGDIFAGFKTFQDLFLGKLIPGLIGIACLLPYSIAKDNRLAPLMDGLRQNPASMNPQEFFSQMNSATLSSLPLLFICLIPAMYFSVNWIFTLMLIADKKMDFWSGIKVSWKMVHKHWFSVFGLLALIGLINIAGFCMCCVGLLATIPLGLAALMYAYEDIFSRKTA